jgi:hypothetical protein
MKVIRTVIYLSKQQRSALKKMSEETGAPVTVLVRRAIIDYLGKYKRI